MAFVPVSDTALVEVKYLYGTEVIENTLWFVFGNDPDESDLEDLAAGVAAAWGSNMIPQQSLGVSLFEVKATSMASDTSPTFTYEVSPPIPGEIGDVPLPSSVTWAVQFRTTNRGRSFRGRNYWIGLTESQVTGNVVNSTLAANIIQGYVDMKGEVNAIGWNHVVVSRFSGGAPRAAGIKTPVSSYGFADLLVDNQRRRLTGRGS